MLKKIGFIFALFVATNICYGQVTITGTVADNTGYTWANAFVTFVLNNPTGGTPIYYPTGAVAQRYTYATANGGAISAVVFPNNTIIPNGTSYTPIVCPFNNNQNCETLPPITVTANIDLTTYFAANVKSFSNSGLSFPGVYDATNYGTTKDNDCYLSPTTVNFFCFIQGVATPIGGSVTSAQILLSQIPTNGLLGLYTHTDCTHPYKDYSGSGNDGITSTGSNAPVCSFSGLYYGPSSAAAWTLPASVTSSAISYVFSLYPASTTLVGPEYPSILDSDSTGGFLSLTGDVIGDYDFNSWSMGMGTNTLYKNTSSNANIPSAIVLSYEIGTGISGDMDQLFANGTEQPYSTQNATTIATFNVGNLRVGGGAGSHPFFGTESVTAVYNRKLTATENVQIANVLNSFTQTRSGLIIPKPLSSSTLPTVVCEGDSITWGLGVTNSWCTGTLFITGQTMNVVKPAAAPSKFLSAMASNAPQDLWPYYSVAAPNNTAYIMGATNDFNIINDTAAIVWNQATRAAQSSKYPNVPVVFMPMLSMTNRDTQKDSFNTLVNSYCKNYYDYCVAPDDPNLYADGANSGTIGTIEACPGATTYFQSDCTHPTTAGQTLLGIYAGNAWLQLHGNTINSPNPVATSTYTAIGSDNYIRPTVSSTITLYNCLGYSRFVQITAPLGFTTSVKNATTAQTINGTDYSTTPLALTAGSTYTFQVVIGAPSTGGCSWITK